MLKILIVEDNEDLILVLSQYLKKAGFETLLARNGIEGLALLEKNKSIKLAVVDIQMPIMDGLEFCNLVRANPEYKDLPIIIISANSRIDDKFLGFRAGADDYLGKPFNYMELLLRIKSMLKRINTEALPVIPPPVTEQQNNSPTIEIEFLKTELGTFSVSLKEKTIALTEVEYKLLEYLYNRGNKPATDEEILTDVMGYSKGSGTSMTVRTHIRNLRKKIEENPKEPEFIFNLPKRGYFFKTG